MIGFNPVGEKNPHSGNTEYSVDFDKKYSINSFAEMLLTERANEWGNVSIVVDPERPYKFDNPSFWYRNGRLDDEKRFKEIVESFGKKPVIKAIAYGGYFRMDYTLWIGEEAPDEPVEEVSLEEPVEKNDISEEPENSTNNVDVSVSEQRSKHRRNRNRNRNHNKNYNENNQKEN